MPNNLSLADHYDPLRLGLRAFAEKEQMCLLNDGLPLDEVLKKTDDMLAYAKTSKALKETPLLDSPTAKEKKKNLNKKRRDNLIMPTITINVIMPNK